MAKIWVEAYGCSASFADSEMISGLIVNGGHTLAQSIFDSDLNLIVTCSVKDATANKMVNRIKKLNSKPLDVIDFTLKGKRRIELEDSDASKVGLPKVRLNPVVGIIEIASGCKSECTFASACNLYYSNN